MYRDNEGTFVCGWKTERCTVIGNYAFDNCTSLTMVDLPDSLTHIGGRTFGYCVNLTEISIPAQVKSTETVYYGNEGPFHESGVVKAIIEEGAAAIPAHLFMHAKKLEEVVIPNSVISIGGNTFADCPNLVICCTAESYVLEYAIKNDLMVNITDWTRPESDILNMDAAYYNTNSSDVNASGYIDLVVHYELKPEQVEKLSDMKLRVLLQSKLVLMENSLRLDGVVPQGYSYKDNVLTVPVTEASGTLRFSVNPESAARLFSRAEFVYTKAGVTDSDIIDCINSDMPVLTLVTNATVNTADIRVSGIAPAEAVLTFFIDDVEAGTATASKAGNYSGELTLPDVQEGKSYTVKAVATVGETAVEKSVTVTYDLASPVLEELLLYYSGHETGRYENYIVDMTDPHAGRTVITFNPTHDYIFRVKMSNPEQISCLYVTSTRNGQTKLIEAKYDEKTGYFVTKDKFDNDVWNYVPGEIGVIYDRTYTELDRSDLERTADALIDETAERIDESKVSAEVLENTETDTVVQAVLPSGDEVGYEYHQFTVEEAFAFLRENGLVPEQEGDVNPHNAEDVAEAVWGIFEYAFDYVTFEEEETPYYVYATDDRMIIFSPFEPDKREDMLSCWMLETSMSRMIDLCTMTENDDAFQIIIGKGNNGGLIMDATSALYKYGNKMWELDLRKQNASPEDLEKIEKAENVIGGVMAARMTLAIMKVLVPALFASVPGIGLIVAVSAFFVEDYLDSVEESEDWVTGFENSIVGTFLSYGDLIAKAAILLGYNLLKWIIDPSGYVYEAVTTNRLPGVTTTVYYKDPETENAMFWDAGEYDQINPIITGPDGSYAWDVPEGLWQVKYELEGYETLYSEWMPVPPPQTDVNVGLVSYAVPEAQWIDVYHDSVELEFSKYMIPDTVDDITLTDAAGNTIAYTLEYSTDETAADGTVYAKEFTLDFDSAFLNHGETCVITIPGGVKSYAGVSAKTDAITRTCTEQIVISAPDCVTVPYGEQAVIPVGLSAEGFDTIEVISMFTELAQVDAIEKTENGWDITVAGNLPGRTALLIALPETNVSKYVEVVIDASDGAHTHDYSAEVTAEPTCTENGVKTWTCEICAEQYTERIPALGHSFGEWGLIQEPTTIEAGLEERSCSRCDYTEQRTVAKLENPFNDVQPGSFYYEPVMWAIENGITNGTSPTTFGPNDQCMRAHVVTFLWRAMGSPEPKLLVNPFVDVRTTDFYYKPVLWALENGITSGMDATHFGPTSYCNRAQVVTFLYRTMGSPELESAENPFTDVAKGSFYEKPVLWAVQNGITNGLSATTFGPNSICNRAQIVTFLYRAFVKD